MEELEAKQTKLERKNEQLHKQKKTLREQLEEETGLKDDILRQLSKALQEADMWRAKYEHEGLAKSEELEMSKHESSQW